MLNFKFEIEVKFGHEIQIRQKLTVEFDLYLVKNFELVELNIGQNGHF